MSDKYLHTICKHPKCDFYRRIQEVAYDRGMTIKRLAEETGLSPLTLVDQKAEYPKMASVAIQNLYGGV